MKKYAVYPFSAMLGGVVGFLLRCLQNQSGFEAGTGLPVSGNLYALLLPLVLAALAVLFLLLTLRLPGGREETPAPFTACFSSAGAAEPTLLAAGLFAVLASGAYQFYDALTLSASRMDLILGALAILSALCLFPLLPACKRRAGDAPQAFDGKLLLVPVVTLVVLLVLTYRADSVNPSLTVYYPELLSQVFLILAFFRVSSFAFGDGSTRRFLLWSMLSVLFCVVSLADGLAPAHALFTAGALLIQLGLMLLRLDALAQSKCPASGGSAETPPKDAP